MNLKTWKFFVYKIKTVHPTSNFITSTNQAFFRVFSNRTWDLFWTIHPVLLPSCSLNCLSLQFVTQTQTLPRYWLLWLMIISPPLLPHLPMWRFTQASNASFCAVWVFLLHRVTPQQQQPPPPLSSSLASIWHPLLFLLLQRGIGKRALKLHNVAPWCCIKRQSSTYVASIVSTLEFVCLFLDWQILPFFPPHLCPHRPMSFSLPAAAARLSARPIKMNPERNKL